MNRLGQPALFGQLLAGVLLGPSVFGLLLPELRQVIFPDSKTLKTMIDAISQIGILLLLLLTGMETNLALVHRRRRAVISSSLSGIAVPFACGVALAYALPTDVVPAHENQLVTALFLGTALAISSVKIVAMTLMEIGVIRRDIGQLILATAILDDTIAWIIIAVIAGIAAHGRVDLASVGASLAGTALFLAFCLTIGRRLVARLIVWVNDHMTIEMPVITAILVVMLTLALTTDLIGVHTALGAFIAGIMIGQSPILTEHIEGELRGFIIAFFSPVFFAVAGLGMDLRTLMDPTLLLFTLAVILVAECRQVRRRTDRRQDGRAHHARIAGAGNRPQCARLDRGDHRQHRPHHGRAEQRALHHDRGDGRGHHHGHAAHPALDDGARAARRR